MHQAKQLAFDNNVHSNKGASYIKQAGWVFPDKIFPFLKQIIGWDRLLTKFASVISKISENVI